MNRTGMSALVLLVASTSAGAAGCGSECGGLCGSDCDLIDCGYDTIKCLKYPDGSDDDALVINYMQSLSGDQERFTARIFIDLVGINQAEVCTIEGDEFLTLVVASNLHDTSTAARMGLPQDPDKDSDCRVSSAT